MRKNDLSQVWIFDNAISKGFGDWGEEIKCVCVFFFFGKLRFDLILRFFYLWGLKVPFFEIVFRKFVQVLEGWLKKWEKFYILWKTRAIFYEIQNNFAIFFFHDIFSIIKENAKFFSFCVFSVKKDQYKCFFLYEIRKLFQLHNFKIKKKRKIYLTNHIFDETKYKLLYEKLFQSIMCMA